METSKKPGVIVEEGAVYVLQAGTKIYVKTADVCAMTGKSNQWIGQLASQGTIHKSGTSQGTMYELCPTIKAYCGLLESRADSPEDDEIAKIEKEKLSAETGIKKAKAIAAMLEVKELQGKMHRSEDVAAMTADLIYVIRGMLMALPGRLAVDVAATKDAAEASELIRLETFKIMEELAGYRYDAKKYEERVRERRRWDLMDDDSDDE